MTLTDADIDRIARRHRRQVCLDRPCSLDDLLAALRASRKRERRYETVLARADAMAELLTELYEEHIAPVYNGTAKAYCIARAALGEEAQPASKGGVSDA